MLICLGLLLWLAIALGAAVFCGRFLRFGLAKREANWTDRAPEHRETHVDGIGKGSAPKNAELHIHHKRVS
jgi:hypothetical protein